jgi:hypothetical protein
VPAPRLCQGRCRPACVSELNWSTLWALGPGGAGKGWQWSGWKGRSSWKWAEDPHVGGATGGGAGTRFLLSRVMLSTSLRLAPEATNDGDLATLSGGAFGRQLRGSSVDLGESEESPGERVGRFRSSSPAKLNTPAFGGCLFLALNGAVVALVSPLVSRAESSRSFPVQLLAYRR